MKKELNKIIYIQAQNAQAGPPLGTILGNVGINTVKFCDEFNKYTKTLPFYLKPKVKVKINENKTYSFTIESLSICHLINLLKEKQIIKKKIKDIIEEKEVYFIKLKDLLILTLYKFPKKKIEESFKMIYGIVRSMKIKIKK